MYLFLVRDEIITGRGWCSCHTTTLLSSQLSLVRRWLCVTAALLLVLAVRFLLMHSFLYVAKSCSVLSNVWCEHSVRSLFILLKRSVQSQCFVTVNLQRQVLRVFETDLRFLINMKSCDYFSYYLQEKKKGNS